MCGGAGTRLDRGEKPLFEVGGAPMIDRVLRAVETSRIDTAHAVTSPLTPETIRRLDGRVPIIKTDGDGYVTDLTAALDRVDRPVLTVVSDLPLVTAELIDRTIDAYADGALTVCVPTELKRRLGVSDDATRAHGGRELSPTGLNVIGEDDAETIRVSYDARLAINVNRPSDAAVADEFARILGGEAVTNGS
ncbi:MAG: NTP transferase domain-containing protein [Natronomonas sp.]|jgi:adenosylcobinamide-phosphate guanylyltransferase|uniref:NTP transferase domain-containing protein n=1 Tax=Natronomonas sp. TaxID=2184060 RepID=UPI00286FC9DF|nr:NTP transferase domain-containing protein [Natronomonas sp.]MDR9430256.1 NTP transferase domain-containing protein [Natronomonas sp.]